MATAENRSPTTMGDFEHPPSGNKVAQHPKKVTFKTNLEAKDPETINIRCRPHHHPFSTQRKFHVTRRLRKPYVKRAKQQLNNTENQPSTENGHAHDPLTGYEFTSKIILHNQALLAQLEKQSQKLTKFAALSERNHQEFQQKLQAHEALSEQKHQEFLQQLQSLQETQPRKSRRSSMKIPRKSRRSSSKPPSPPIISIPPENTLTTPTHPTTDTTIIHPLHPTTTTTTTDTDTNTHPAIFHTTTDTTHPAIIQHPTTIDTTTHDPAIIHLTPTNTTDPTSTEPPCIQPPSHPTKTTPAPLPTIRMPHAHLTRPLFRALNGFLSFPTPPDRPNPSLPYSTPNTLTPVPPPSTPTPHTHSKPLFRALNGFLSFPTPPDRPRSTQQHSRLASRIII
jgi:hypothetical protein